MIKDVDPERLQRFINVVRESVSNLRELGSLSEAEFYSDKHKQGSAKYNFIVAIEAAIDLASHVISRKALRAPEDYADTFKVLTEAGVLGSGFASELEKMARFRNRLVHLYWDVNVREIWKILQTRLNDFEQYIAKVGTYLGAHF